MDDAEFPAQLHHYYGCFDGAGENVYAQKEGDVHRVSAFDERAVAKHGCAPLSDKVSRSLGSALGFSTAVDASEAKR